MVGRSFNPLYPSSHAVSVLLPLQPLSLSYTKHQDTWTTFSFSFILNLLNYFQSFVTGTQCQLSSWVFFFLTLCQFSMSPAKMLAHNELIKIQTTSKIISYTNSLRAGWPSAPMSFPCLSLQIRRTHSFGLNLR